MSQDAPSNRKEKKALRDAERQRKGKKRKHAETIEPPAVPGDDQNEVEKEFISLAPNDENAAPATVKKSKKRKHDEERTDAEVGDAAADNAEQAHVKPKKRKKAKSSGQEPAEGDVEGERADVPAKPSKSRFIVFVGNLPYETTNASLQAHFKKLSPFTLRHRTDPKTNKSKGFAFLEFENYDRMKTCLKLYHHGMFDPEDYREESAQYGPKQQNHGNKKKGARRINVELTAGGGGKSEARKQKLTEKNVRLEEQRKRRAEAEMKKKAAAERKGAKGGKQKGLKEQVEPEAAGESHTAGMHPSRLARMQG